MTRVLLRLLVASAILLAAPAAASANSAGGRVTLDLPSGPAGVYVNSHSGEHLGLAPPTLHPTASQPIGLPFWTPPTWNLRPIGFTTDADQAILIAESNPTMQAIHRQYHPLQYEPLVWELAHWEIWFQYHGKTVAAVVISPSGHVTEVYTGGPATAIYARGHFGGMFDSWWIVIPFGLLFLVPFMDWRRPLRMLHLDALVLLSFGLSYLAFDQVYFKEGVWLAYPPLLYLLGRCLYIGLRRGGVTRSPLSRLPLGVLIGGVGLLVAARVILNVIDGPVMDVGYASIVGASRALHGQPIYYPGGALHYDTYGPINYLAYMPFVKLFGWDGKWDTIPAAHAATLTFDLLTVAGLLVLGKRLRPGQTGWRLGLTMSWAWCAYPFTLFGVMKNTNDGLIAMLLVWSLVAFASPVRRGLLLALAAAAKFVPAILLPLYMAGRGERGARPKLACAATFVFVAGGTVLLYLPSGGISEFYDHTIGFQLSRSDVFSIWSLYPSLSWLKVVVEIGAVGLAVALGWARHPRSMAQVAALAGALMIAVQLPALHWFYFYIVWFAPFVFVALFARDTGVPTGDGAPSEAAADERSSSATVAVAV